VDRVVRRLGLADDRDRVAGDVDRHDHVGVDLVVLRRGPAHPVDGGDADLVQRRHVGHLVAHHGQRRQLVGDRCDLVRQRRREVAAFLRQRRDGVLGLGDNGRRGPGRLGDDRVRGGRDLRDRQSAGELRGADCDLPVEAGNGLLAERRAEGVVAEVDGDGDRTVKRRRRLVRVHVLVGRSDAGTQHQQTTGD
jgi:hypothetical protein